MTVNKLTIYQVLIRLFGNKNNTNKPNGTLLENGVGKFDDFTFEALSSIKDMGFSHIWYTGVLEHATQTDYSAYGIENDCPAIVKGIAGSPYAIKDYYDVDPDLAENIQSRKKEFESLITRTHQSGLKVIIDFIPNHVARVYKSDSKPGWITDLGECDDSQFAFLPQNNFYYIPGTMLCPRFNISGIDNEYVEYPAKATGNDRFDAFPERNDWYDTVKLNYGVDYCGGRIKYFDPIPPTWHQMLDILKYWTQKGVDGFRCDMAEMVPVEFWEWAIPQVKEINSKVLFIAEVYNPLEYRNYLFNGKFDYLYDKVGLYDTLKSVICHNHSTLEITGCWQQLEGIQKKMLNFLENHDEQRIASDFFAKDPVKAIPALIVSFLMNTNPVLVYFGQELGERGMDAEGYSGCDGRTTIFDYWSVDTIRRWNNDGKFNNDRLTEKELNLRDLYIKVVNVCKNEKAISDGRFFDLMYANTNNVHFDYNRVYAFMRGDEREVVLVAANFADYPQNLDLWIPRHAFEYFKIPEGVSLETVDLLSGEKGQFVLEESLPLCISVDSNSAIVVKMTW